MQAAEFKTPKELYANYQAVAHRLRNRHYVYPVTPIAAAVTREPTLAQGTAESRAEVIATVVAAAEVADVVQSDAKAINHSLPEFLARLAAGEIPKSKRAAEWLVELVADKHGVSFGEMIGTSRATPFVMARREAYWLLHTTFNFSLKQVAAVLRKDHTSVLHGVRMYVQDNPQ